MKYLIDFAPGQHGHFLELVVNRYIFGVPFSGNLFQQSGAVHLINDNTLYQQSKVVRCRHYSSANFIYDNDAKKIIYIEIDDTLLEFVWLTNIYYRCHPTAIHADEYNRADIIKFHQDKISGIGLSDLTRRNDWFAKLNENLTSAGVKQQSSSVPTHKFAFSCFFNLTAFCIELNKLAHFLGETFKYDCTLPALWQEFINKNQGWALYQEAATIIDAMLLNLCVEIPDNWMLQAFLNYRISKMFDLHDGALHEDVRYPSTTTELLSIITNHIKNFDSRW